MLSGNIEIYFRWGIGLLKIKNLKNGNKDKIVVPVSLREGIINYFHSGMEGAHQGRDTVIEKISRRFWWPKSKSDIYNLIFNLRNLRTVSNRTTEKSGIAAD